MAINAAHTKRGTTSIGLAQRECNAAYSLGSAFNHHPESHHRNIQKEFLTPTIVIEMLRIEQQLQQKVARAA
jgi:hypothetical protein